MWFQLHLKASHTAIKKNIYLSVDALREAGALNVSLVAELEGKIVGHIAFTQVKINNKKCSWFGLAPVSVHPEY